MGQTIGPRELALRAAREALAKGSLTPREMFPKSLTRIERAIDKFAALKKKPKSPKSRLRAKRR